ncbi:hypothetical protein Tco_0500632 [Tanacetum coccineum]
MLEEKVPLFLPTDDPFERLNKALALFRSAITSRYPLATVQEGKVDMGKALDVRKQRTEKPEIITEGRVDKYTEQCQVKSPMLDSSLDNKTIEFLSQSLEFGNILLKKTVAQF